MLQMHRATWVVKVIPASSSRASSTFHTSASSSSLHSFRRAFIETNDAVCGTRIWCRGRSFASSVPSDSTKPRKVYKKIPKDKRRAMVEVFVKKYRAANAGRFPGPYFTRQEVGGSYYVIKEILGMLEYESKNSSMDKIEEVALKNLEQHVDHHIHLKEQHPNISTSRKDISLEQTTFAKPGAVAVTDHIEVDEFLSVEAQETSEESLMPSLVGSSNINEEFIGRTSETKIGEATMSSSRVPDVEDRYPVDPRKAVPICDFSEKYCRNLDTVIDGVCESKPGRENGPKLHHQGGQEAPKQENLQRDISGECVREEPLPKRSTIWSNLKSIADGIISFWKKP